MKKILIMCSMLMFAGVVLADNMNTQDQTSTSTATNSGNNQTAGSINQPITVNIDQSSSNDNTTRGGITDPNYNVNDNRSDIHYSGEYTMRNVPNVSAPALTTTLTETCMGSTSIGGAGICFGISFGTTWRDSACVRRLDARQLQALGYTLGAKELMCDSDAVRQALKRAGKPCYVDLPLEEKRPEDRVAPAKKEIVAPASGFTSSNYDILDN